MKKLEFETSKGRFVLVDNPILPQAMSITTKYIKLSEITEEQASRIVDEPFWLEVGDNKILVFKDYEDEENTYLSSINSLHSLLKSKGIHLYENPYDLDEQLDCNCDMCYQKLEDAFDEAEEKTFYNPYIFKL